MWIKLRKSSQLFKNGGQAVDSVVIYYVIWLRELTNLKNFAESRRMVLEKECQPAPAVKC